MSVRACPPRQRVRAGDSAGSNYTPPYQTTCIQVVQCTGRGASNNCGFAREKRGSGMPHHTCRQEGRTDNMAPTTQGATTMFVPTDRQDEDEPTTRHDWRVCTRSVGTVAAQWWVGTYGRRCARRNLCLHAGALFGGVPGLISTENQPIRGAEALPLSQGNAKRTCIPRIENNGKRSLHV
jgi:hypothetical protein